ncbi:MAG: LysE family translocator [Alphaproteobacteria bacterium]|nr:MAG: LysE family translocator [Alphaproteobacteria bacterium]
MSPELYAAFVLASALLALTPGPAMSLIVANSASFGLRAGMLTVAGASTGLALLVTGATLGMSSVMALMADGFDLIRWAGAAYLVWLGGRRLFHALSAGAGVAGEGAGAVQPRGRWFWQGLAVTLSNPKVLLFLGAFFPQFVNPASSLAVQLGLLGITFVVTIMVIDAGVAVMAGSTRRFFTGARMRTADALGGILLVCGGLWLALARRA